MYMNSYGLIGLGGMGFGLVFMAFLWFLVLLGTVYIIRHLGAFYKWEKERKTPDEALVRRYLKGAITMEEFNEKMKIHGDER